MAVLAFALPGCERTSQPAAPARSYIHLSTQNPESNLAAVVDFVKKTCVDAVNDPGEIAGAIEDSHWRVKDEQASAGQMVTVRDLEHGRIAYSAIPFEAPGGRFRDCQIELDGSVAPSLARLRDALFRAIYVPSIRQTSAAGAAIAWRWQPDPMQDRTLSLAAPGRDGARPGFSIHMSSTEYTMPPRAAETAAPALNATAEPVEMPSDDGATNPDQPTPGADSTPPARYGQGNGAAPY